VSVAEGPAVVAVVAGPSVADDDALARWVNAGADYALSLPPK